MGVRLETFLWLAVPPFASISVLIAGLVMRRSPSTRRQWAGSALLFLGILGVVLSAAWLLLVAYVEKVVR
jgi:hypothetical protein